MKQDVDYIIVDFQFLFNTFERVKDLPSREYYDAFLRAINLMTWQSLQDLTSN